MIRYLSPSEHVCADVLVSRPFSCSKLSCNQVLDQPFLVVLDLVQDSTDLIGMMELLEESNEWDYIGTRV